MARSWFSPTLWFRLTLAMSLAAAGAWAQSGDTTTLTMKLSGPGTGEGRPGLIDGSLDFASFTVTNSVGNSIGIPILFVGLAGGRDDSLKVTAPTDTNIVVVPAGNPNDVLHFHDANATLMNNGRKGTAIVDWGAGAFHGATGQITYTLKCTFLCAGDDGNPMPGLFTFTFSVSDGSLTLNTAVAQGILPDINAKPQPSPPPPPAAPLSSSGNNFNNYTTPDGNIVIPQNSSGGTGTGTGTGSTTNFRPGKAVPAVTGSSSTGDSLTITPPWEVVPTTFSATATCPTIPAECWMTVPTASGTIPPFTNTPIEVDLDFGTLGAGVYPANLSLTTTPSGGTAATESVPFTLLVGNGAPLLQISETGIPFQAVAGVQASPPPHTISLSTFGAAIPYTATASTLTGGSWLTVSPAAGMVTSSLASSVSIAANPAGLAAGTYFGRVDISAPAAFKPLQSVEVTFTVASSTGTAPILSAPLLSAAGVVFVTPQSVNPAPQTVTVSTFSASAMAVTGQASGNAMGTWLTPSASATALQAGHPITETLSVNSKGLAPGVYNGVLYEVAAGAVTEASATVLLVVTPASSTCTATQLLPVLTDLEPNFEFTAGLPVSLQAEVVDDCGNILTSGVVEATFSNGDSAVEMTPAGGGLWAGTWQPHGLTGGPLSVGINASSGSGLAGVTSTSGILDANSATPVVNPGGIANAAGLVAASPLAPGEFISIFGSNLGPSTAVVSPVPYPTMLGGTQVLLGGQPLPLQVVSAGQINAVVPYGATVNGLQDLLVEQNGMYSLQETLVGAVANPAAFTVTQSGQGAGAIIVVKPNGTAFVASATQTASAGDVLEIYGAGLGPVSPAVADGAAAPSTPVLAQTVNPVTATIGGQKAQVQFAGLAPGFAGLYQVNVVVPAGVSGANVPIVLTTSGFSSPPVTVAIQ